jgi:hypothetical protein
VNVQTAEKGKWNVRKKRWKLKKHGTIKEFVMEKHGKLKEFMMITSVTVMREYAKVSTSVLANATTTTIVTVVMIMTIVSIVIGMIIKVVDVHENEMMMVITTVAVLVTVKVGDLAEIVLVAGDLAEIVLTVKAGQIAATVNVTEIKILDRAVMTIEIGSALREVTTEAVIENVNEIVIDLIAAKTNKVVIILRNVVEVKSVLIRTVLTAENETLKMKRIKTKRILIRIKVHMMTILIDTQDEMMIVIEMAIQVVTVINVLDVRMKLTAAEERVANVKVAKVALIKVQEQDRLVMITLMMKERLIKPMTMTFLLLMIMTMIFLTLHRL